MIDSSTFPGCLACRVLRYDTNGCNSFISPELDRAEHHPSRSSFYKKELACPR